MRWLVLACAIVLASRPAAARKIVIMEPPLARACQTAKSWPLLMDCLKQHGLKGTVVRQLDDSKLLVVQSLEAKRGEIETWALYVANGTGWKLGGLAQDGGYVADTEVLRFERVTAGGHHGYRFDIASTQQSAVSLDQVTTQTSVLRQTQATFCSGASYSCMTLVPSCTQLVFGQAVLAFEGSIAIADNQIKLTGTGTQPQSCSSAGTYTTMLQ
ncbi:MAG TPA: hypothetical protein VFQ65_24510 [Kofleriaceae bacterium]|nr:hypothetical protein [Kofleriaceae bacterium]